MIRLDAVRARIEAKVSALVGRTGNAGDYGTIIGENLTPPVTPFAYVLPGGLQGGAADMISGMFRQAFAEVVIVVLFVSVAADALGDAGLAEADPLVRAIVEGVCGWGPADALDVFELGRAELVGSKDGLLVFQIDFQLNDQLRITSS